jgi:hypothetical protein
MNVYVFNYLLRGEVYMYIHIYKYIYMYIEIYMIHIFADLRHEGDDYKLEMMTQNNEGEYH